MLGMCVLQILTEVLCQFENDFQIVAHCKSAVHGHVQLC